MLIKSKPPASAFQKVRELSYLFQDRDIFNFTGQEFLALLTSYKRWPSSIRAPYLWMERWFLSQQCSNSMGASCFAGPDADFFLLVSLIISTIIYSSNLSDYLNSNYGGNSSANNVLQFRTTLKIVKCLCKNNLRKNTSCMGIENQLNLFPQTQHTLWIFLLSTTNLKGRETLFVGI